MAEVFLAKDARGELVAIKRILPHLASEIQFVQMFLDEARIAAQLHHPNIVQLKDLGKLHDTLFLTMEYVEGADLRRILTQQVRSNLTMPFGVAARITAEVGKGLAYAHNSVGMDGRPLEVVHRDVSPQNVMVGFDGTVKLVDFGIARAGSFMATSNPGVLKGKFLYLTPEQISKQRVDHRADLFSLGTLLYEIATGASPFARPSGEAVIYAIRTEEPLPPSELRPGFPPRLSAIILRCLEKDREKRYQEASDVVADLEGFLASQSSADLRAVRAHLSALFGDLGERTRVHIPSSPEPVRSPVPQARPTRSVPVLPLMAPPVRTTRQHSTPPQPPADVTSGHLPPPVAERDPTVPPALPRKAPAGPGLRRTTPPPEPGLVSAWTVPPVPVLMAAGASLPPADAEDGFPTVAMRLHEGASRVTARLKRGGKRTRWAALLGMMLLAALALYAWLKWAPGSAQEAPASGATVVPARK